MNLLLLGGYRFLGRAVDTHVFLSTLSVYDDPLPVWSDESAPRKRLPDGADRMDPT